MGFVVVALIWFGFWSFLVDAAPPSEKPSENKERLQERYRIMELLDAGRDREAMEEWARFIGANPRLNTWDELAWKLAQAYVRLGEYDEAIDLYKPHYHIVSESIEERAELGEILIFGEIGARPKHGEGVPIGKGHCSLCHGFSKDYRESGLFLNLYGVIKQAKRLVASPRYQQRPKDTVQPEAFPGSGIATNVMEYLAESNVCPSCYVVPGFSFRGAQDRESPMPAIHKPPIRLTIEEMITIDTWLLKQEEEEIPSVQVMRTAYEKFLRPEDRPGSYAAIRLASLYDAKGDLDTAVHLLEVNYAGVLKYDSGLYQSRFEKLALLRDDPTIFVNLKKRSNIITRFPTLLRVTVQH